MRSSPGPITGQLAPQIPPIQEQETHPIGHTSGLAFLGHARPQIPLVQEEQVGGIFWLAVMNQAAQLYQIAQGLGGRHPYLSQRAISILGGQRRSCLNQRLGVAYHMGFTHLLGQPQGHRDLFEAISIIRDEQARPHLLGNGRHPRLQGRRIFP